MANKNNKMGAEAIDFPLENGVHIAGVTGSSPVSPTTQLIENKRTKAKTVHCPSGQLHLVRRVQEVFSYDPVVGHLFRRNCETPAGRLLQNGYLAVSLDGIVWREHRLIWIWVHGVVPGEYDEIDHIDGNRTNNRIDNLRLVTRLQNQWNSKVRTDNTSGFKGVSWNKKAKRWAANISIGGRVTYLGMYDTAEEAHEAYAVRAKEMRGDFARTK